MDTPRLATTTRLAIATVTLSIVLAGTAAAVDSVDETITATWEVDVTGSDEERTFNMSIIYHGVPGGGSQIDEANFVDGNIRILRFNKTDDFDTDFDTEIWNVGAQEWQSYNESPTASASVPIFDSDCDDSNENRWACIITNNHFPPKQIEPFFIEANMEIGHGTLQENTFLSVDYRMNGTEGPAEPGNETKFEAHDHSLAQLTETETNELLFWGALFLFSLWHGWPFLAVIFMMGLFRPLFLEDILAFRLVLALSIVGLWAQFWANAASQTEDQDKDRGGART